MSQNNAVLKQDTNEVANEECEVPYYLCIEEHKNQNTIARYLETKYDTLR
jgi:hypothetical protein